MAGKRRGDGVNRWVPRALSASVAAVLIAVGLPFSWPGAVPEADAAFGAGQPARFNENVNGDFLLIGDTVLECDGGVSNGANCTTSNFNDYLDMGNADPDGNGPLFNGSSGTLTIPSGSVVEAAFLYWGANLGATNSGRYYCSANHERADNATADKSLANTAKLKVGAGPYTTVTAVETHTFPTGGLGQSLPSGNTDGLIYEGVADVTSLLAATPAATATTVSVADIQAMQGPNCHAGWALALVYSFPTFNCLTGNQDGSNTRNDYRNVAIYDGLLNQRDGAAPTSTTLDGFITTSGTSTTLRLGTIAWEGDQNITNDRLAVRSNLSGSDTFVDPAGPSGSTNFFDSGKQPVADHNADLDSDPDSGATIERGFVGGRNDGHAVDAKTQTVSVPGGTSSIDVKFSTEGDNYYPGGFALSSPITCLLQLDKDQAVNGDPVARDNSTTPNPAVRSGDELTFTVPAKAVGDVPLTNVVISDLVPASTTYVAGSAKWGVGNTPAAAHALPNNASFGSGTVSASVGSLDPLDSGGNCPSGNTCFAELQFRVTVDAGLATGTVITNQATSTFTASGVTNIREQSNDVTDIVGPRLTITKDIVNPVAGDPTAFNFAVACNGSAVAGSPFSLADLQDVTLPVPPGSTCTVTETTSPNFATTVTGAITSNGGSVVMDGDKSVTFSNTRRFGRISVNKTVVPVAGDPTAAPTFSFTVACPGIAGYPLSLTVPGTGGAAQTPADIPFGTSCSVTEATAPGWDGSPSVSIDPLDEAVETAAFTNTRRTGDLTIAKTTTGGDGSFTFSVDCDGTAYDTTRTVGTSAGSGSVTISGLPSGIGCTVSETVPAGWTLNSANDVGVTIPDGGAATAAFSNARQTADLVITKAVSGTYAIPVSTTFAFDVDCGPAGVFSRDISASSLANGSATVSGIPVGTGCSVSEVVPAGWSLDASISGNTASRSVTIAENSNSVTFTNRHDVGQIRIDKTIDRGSGTFDFDVVCDNLAVPGNPHTITIDAPDTSGSAVIADVPTGAECTVDEIPDGSVDDNFVQVVPAAGGVVTISPVVASNTATFVNARRTGSLVISKVFPPGSLGDVDQTFDFNWDCGPEPRSISLKAGQTHRIDDIPTGTQCIVSEIADPEYTTTIDPSGGVVTIGEGDNVVTVTNTAKTGTLTVVKDLVPASDDGRFDLVIDGVTAAGAVGDGGTTGALTQPVGSYVVTEAVAAGNGADLADYDTSLSCAAGGVPVPIGQDGAVPVASGADVVCLFTNSAKPTIEIVKNLTPADDPGVFTLTLDGAPVTTGGNGATSGRLTIATGAHTVGEIAGNGDSDLADYDSSISCSTNGGPATAGGAVDASHGDDITCVVTNTRKAADLSIAKDPGSAFVLPGGVATFSITVSNAGGAGLARDVAVLDALPAGVTYLASQGDVCDPDGTVCELGDLAAGQSRTFTISYQVDGDIAGSVVANVAAVTSPDDPSSPEADAEIPVARLEVVKNSAETSFSQPGDAVTYFYAVTNTGGVALSGVTVADNKIPTDQIDCNSGAAGNGQPFALAVGETLTCSAVAVVTPADIAAGVIDNVATVDSTETEPTGDEWSVPLAALDITKTLTSVGPFARGDALNYRIVVRNVGQIALTDVTVSDPAAEGFDPSTDCDPTAPASSLAVGAEIVCEASHVISQTDIDAGLFTNTATANSDETLEASADVTTTFTQTPALTLDKNVVSSGPYDLGDTVTYSLVATNSGNVTLTGVAITESAGAVLGTCDPLAPTALAPGGSLTCAASYVITQADIDAGTHTNVATAESDRTEPASDEAKVPVTQSPDLSISKIVTSENNDDVGDVITFDIVTTNTGNMTLTGVMVTDDLADLGECDAELPTTLAPGETITCEATHTVTQADIDAGIYTNVATADSDQTDPCDAEETVEFEQSPELRLDKTVTSEGPYDLGDTVTYSLVANNTGNITLTGVEITESAGATLGTCDPITPASLAPGATLTCEAAHVITQADVDAGTHTNIATADSHHTDPVSDEAEVPVTQNPELTITKDSTSEGPFALGDTLTFEIVATNTGNTTLTAVTVTDEAAELGACDTELPATLAPGDTITCEATHDITQDDFDAGSYVNTAVGNSEQTGSVDDTETVPTPDPAVDLTILKTLDGELVTGETATYVLVVTNNGPATATSIAVTDDVPDGLQVVAAGGTDWECTLSGNAVRCVASAELASGESLPPITVTITVTATGGTTITNVATVTGDQVDRDPSNNTDFVEANVSEILPVTQTPDDAAPTATPTAAPVPSGTMASTGTSTVLLAGTGAVIALIGVALVAATRSRRRD